MTLVYEGCYKVHSSLKSVGNLLALSASLCLHPHNRSSLGREVLFGRYES